MHILDFLDVVWAFAIPLLVIAVALMMGLRWISRGVLVAFIVYKMLLCIGTNVWIVESDAPSDTVGFYYEGLNSADKLRDLLRGESLDYLQDPLFFWIDGIATSRIINFAGLLLTITGNSFLAVNLLMCTIGIIGQLMLYRYFAERFPQANRFYFALILFHPSLSMWSSSLLKDTIGIFALGCSFLNINRCLQKFSLSSFLWVLISVYLSYLYRPYILLIVGVLGLFMIWDVRIDKASMRLRGNNLTKLVYLCSALAVALAGIVYFLLTQADELAFMQRESDEAYSRLEGGTNFTNVSVTYSVSSVILLPVGLVNTLIRPFPWEVRKLNHLMAALENIWMLVFVLRGWYIFLRKLPDGLRRYCRSIMYGGLLVTCIAGSAIGLFASNLGTISRYRIPVIPTLLAGPCVVLAMHNARSSAFYPVPLS